MVLKCAVKLRLFDAIHHHGAGDHPISLPELAASLLVPPNRLSVLRRLMRYLAESFFEWMARDPGVSSRFNAGMLCTVGPIIEAVLKGCPEVFQGVNVLVDVGGGAGVAAAAIARAFSGIRCVVYDLPHVVEEAPKWDAVEYEAGDMFVSVPHADALLQRRVLHAFDDEKALRILKLCKEAIFEDKGKLIIIDEVINEAEAKELLHVKLAYDMLLMQYTGGKERTKSEWRSLLLKAGFTRCKITHVMALQHIIEAHP
ncbi:Chavicol O-methyltransferase [Platanthera guangdongensis]|uniref:Chavicol O-methyltransferase n=1 Tax=Platanthera guangdongensis TaxID=2320717 RepID=A0ABR2N262_9ASPA